MPFNSCCLRPFLLGEVSAQSTKACFCSTRYSTVISYMNNKMSMHVTQSGHRSTDINIKATYKNCTEDL